LIAQCFEKQIALDQFASQWPAYSCGHVEGSADRAGLPALRDSNP
jgi:hypothetical protein